MTLQTRPAVERRRHPTMAEAALAELQDSILSGELPPGSPLRLERGINALWVHGGLMYAPPLR